MNTNFVLSLLFLIEGIARDLELCPFSTFNPEKEEKKTNRHRCLLIFFRNPGIFFPETILTS